MAVCFNLGPVPRKIVAIYSNVLYTVLEIGSGRAKNGVFLDFVWNVTDTKMSLGHKYLENGRPSWITSHNFENEPFYARKR